jgi:hypothetical protein
MGGDCEKCLRCETERELSYCLISFSASLDCAGNHLLLETVSADLFGQMKKSLSRQLEGMRVFVMLGLLGFSFMCSASSFCARQSLL